MLYHFLARSFACGPLLDGCVVVRRLEDTAEVALLKFHCCSSVAVIAFRLTSISPIFLMDRFLYCSMVRKELTLRGSIEIFEWIP